MLGEYFNQSMGALEDTLKNIMGEGDPGKILMAAQTNCQLQTSVGRFFADGKFLTEKEPVDMYTDVLGKANELLVSYSYTKSQNIHC
jgi:hypothetical protein